MRKSSWRVTLTSGPNNGYPTNVELLIEPWTDRKVTDPKSVIREFYVLGTYQFVRSVCERLEEDFTVGDFLLVNTLSDLIY